MDNKGLLQKIQKWFVRLAGQVFMFFDWVYSLIEKYHVFSQSNPKWDRMLWMFFGSGFVLLAILSTFLKHALIVQVLCACLIFLFTHGLLKGLYICLNSVSLSVISLLLFNAGISGILCVLLVEQLHLMKQYFYSFFISYSVLWIFYSLLAQTKVSKVANEIMAGLSALVYTLASHYLNLLTDKQILDWFTKIPGYTYDPTDQSLAELETFLVNTNFVRELQNLSGLLLISVGLSALLVVIVNLRVYWEDKYRDKELAEVLDQ